MITSFIISSIFLTAFFPSVRNAISAEAFILWFTAIFVFAYTEAAQKTNELKIRPILNLYVRGGGKNKRFALRNIGSGPAYNIEVEQIDIDLEHLRLFFDEENLILESGGDERQLGLADYDENNKSFKSISEDSATKLGELIKSKNLRYYIDQENKSLVIPILVYYQDVNGSIYHSVFRFYSKLMLAGDLVLEFLKNGTGKIDDASIKELTLINKRVRSVYESINK